MGRITVVYGTNEGQTSKIAHHVAKIAERHGQRPDVLHAAELPSDFDIEAYGAAIVAASVHEGRHQPYVETFCREHRDWLAHHPSMFLSVSLTAAHPELEAQAETQGYVDLFAQTTGWHPPHVGRIAGALRYTEYAWWKRMLVRSIARDKGDPTDVKSDHELTDWHALDQLTQEFLAQAFPRS